MKPLPGMVCIQLPRSTPAGCCGAKYTVVVPSWKLSVPIVGYTLSGVTKEGGIALWAWLTEGAKAASTPVASAR
jgi:hypothetical protein